MTEIDVILTDYLLSIESFVFGLIIYKISGISRLSSAFLIFFGAFFFSSFLGGTVHGFFNEPGTVHTILWKLTLLSIGVAAYGLAQAGLVLLQIYSAKIRILLALILSVYSVLIFFEDHFYIAILCYLPATLLMLFGFVKVYLKWRESEVLMGVLGLILSLVAALFQQFKISIHPQYFNHNSVYHCILMLVLVVVFIAARNVCLRKTGLSTGNCVLEG